MKEHNLIGLREMLEKLPTDELDTMLQAELELEEPNPESVRLILSVLEEREDETPAERTPQEERAWSRYQERVSTLQKKPARNWSWVTKAASVILIVGLLFAVVPQKAEAETFWEMLQRLTSTVLEFLGREDRLVEKEYKFETDNPGLQQVYDAAVEQGITGPVVPMWLLEGSKISFFEIEKSPMMASIVSSFSADEGEIVLKIIKYANEPAHQYYRDDSHYESFERNGTIYNITRNNNRWVAVWTNDNLECSLTLDCPEDTLWRILESIYVMEDN